MDTIINKFITDNKERILKAKEDKTIKRADEVAKLWLANVSGDLLRNRFNRHIKWCWNKIHKASFSINESVDLKEEVVDWHKEFTLNYFWWESLTTKQQFLDHIHFDSSKDYESSYRMNVREVVLWDRNDKHIVKKYEHFLSTKPKTISNDDLLNAYINATAHKTKYVPQRDKEWDLLFQVDIYDMHFEKRSCLWEEDVEVFVTRAVNNLLQTADPYKDRISKIVLPIGNDFFNVDNIMNMTTRWTPQVHRMSFADAIEKWTEFIISLVEKLSEIAPVVIPVVPWNHDASLSISLWVAIKYAFINDKNIEVLVDQFKWKFYKWGNNLLAWDHWDRLKPAVFKDLIKEEPRRFGITLDDVYYYYWYLGHLHHNIYKQLEWFRQYWPVHIEHLWAPSAIDQWHLDNAYLSMRTIHWHLYSKTKWRIAKFDCR